VEIVHARTGEEKVLRFSELRALAKEKYSKLSKKGSGRWPF
jgi:hypothetical protein